MGGKTKQTPRTKNNARPASSGRSAELLNSTVPALVGFAALAENKIIPVLPGLGGGAAGQDDFEGSVDPNFQMVLRRMSKKDPTTKIKACQEMCTLIKNSEVPVVKAVIPFWPRLYGNLATDVEHRVREFSQQVQMAFVERLGKQIAPQLKVLLPIWVTSQFDLYAPAASIALNSFQKAFPEHKIKEVLIFCQSEIFDYLEKNLIFSTPTSMNNSTKSLTPEEVEAKYERVITSCFHAYALYLNYVPIEMNPAVVAMNESLVRNPKFWSYSKSKSNHIRAGFFKAVSAILQFAKVLLKENEKTVAGISVQFLDDTDPLVVPQVWSVFLLVQSNIKNWCEFINFEKAFKPKISAVLKAGGSGNATVIYPHLLPMLPNFIDSIESDKLLEYLKLFITNIEFGLREKIISSGQARSDITAISKALFECIRYVLSRIDSLTNWNDEIIKKDFGNHLISSHVNNLYKWSVETPILPQCGKVLYLNMASLINYLHENVDKFKVFESFLELFWSDVMQYAETSFKNADNLDHEIESHSNWLQTFHGNLCGLGKSKRKSGSRVKFCDPNETEPQVDEVDAGVENNSVFMYIERVAIILCKAYIKGATEYQNPLFITHVERIFSKFESSSFLKKMYGDDLMKLYEKFSVWLMLSNMRSELVVDLIMLLYKHMSDCDKKTVLNKLIKFAIEDVQYWTLMRLLSHPLVSEPYTKQLLKEDHVRNLILKSADCLISAPGTENINLLEKCFYQSGSDELLITKETCHKLLQKIAIPLKDKTRRFNFDSCVSFLARTMSVIYDDPEMNTIRDEVFLNLFELCIHEEPSEELSSDTIWEARTAWEDCLSVNKTIFQGELMNGCCEIMRNELMEAGNASNENNSIEKVNRIADSAYKLMINSLDDLEGEQRESKVDIVLRNILCSIGKDTQCTIGELEKFSAFILAIRDYLTLSKSNSDVLSNMRKTTDIPYFPFAYNFFKFLVVYKLISNELDTVDDEDRDDDDDMNEKKKGPTFVINWSDDIFNLILNSIYFCSVGDIVIRNCTKLNPIINDYVINLQEKLTVLFREITDDQMQKVKSTIFVNAAEKGLLWARCVTIFLEVNSTAEEEKGVVSIQLLNDIMDHTQLQKQEYSYLNVIQSLTSMMQPKCLPISFDQLKDKSRISQIVLSKCLLRNHFCTNYNELDDRLIIDQSLIIFSQIVDDSKSDKTWLLYNQNIESQTISEVLLVAELAQFLSLTIKHFARELTLPFWDFVRIALSSWILTVSKSVKSFELPQVACFISSVMKLFARMSELIKVERVRSSTKNISDMIEEWEAVFAKDVHLIMIKSFTYIVEHFDGSYDMQLLLEEIAPCIDFVEFKYLIQNYDKNSRMKVDDIIKFSLDNISNKCHSIRSAAKTIISQLGVYIVRFDTEQMLKIQNESVTMSSTSSDNKDWHLLNKFKTILQQQQEVSTQKIDNLMFKIVDIGSFSPVDTELITPFYLIWDAILDICDSAKSELRSMYASYLTENNFYQFLMTIVLRTMPIELLKNPDLKSIGQPLFTSLNKEQMFDPNLSGGHLGCHIYMKSLRVLPAVARKWWDNLFVRHKILIERITVNFISGPMIQDEMKAIVKKMTNEDKMLISVLSSTREIIATYCMDEARLELKVILPVNHPLGFVKVEGGKQIGGRLQSRDLVMQLTIFLTHQNGTIWDGLLLWKNNLDRKFEGVEECYVCYSVIHQDTFELPRLNCKTCNKRFHRPCLYKWFKTSNKSTCPICRNMF